MNTLLKTVRNFSLSALGLFVTAGSLMAQSTDNTINPAQAAGAGVGGLIGLLIGVFMIVAMWKIFVKAGQPGWAAIVPIYNLYILCKISGKPGWWLILFCIPFVNFIVAILLALALAKSFGKGGGFAVGMIFLPFIFYPILGFGSATYAGPAA